MHPQDETSPLPPLDVDGLIADIETQGFARISGFIPLDELGRAQGAVRGAVQANGGESVMLIGDEQTSAVLPMMDRVTEVTRLICERVETRHADLETTYKIVRCLSGGSVAQHSMVFHFDSFVLTALVPVIMPVRGSPGDLVIAPNTRPLRNSYMRNLLDKLIVDNPLTQRILRRMHAGGSARFTRLHLAPGDLYLFWGYRTLHTNEPVDGGEVRCTALVHRGRMHPDSALWRALHR